MYILIYITVDCEYCEVFWTSPMDMSQIKTSERSSGSLHPQRRLISELTALWEPIRIVLPDTPRVPPGSVHSNSSEP